MTDINSGEHVTTTTNNNSLTERWIFVTLQTTNYFAHNSFSTNRIRVK